MRQAPLFCYLKRRRRDCRHRIHFHPIYTQPQKQALEGRARHAAERLKKAGSGARYVARSLSSIERRVVVAPLNFSHEIATVMRECRNLPARSRSIQFFMRLCRRFVLFYLPYVGMAIMVCVVGTVNVFASAKTGGATPLHAAYAATIRESVTPSQYTGNDAANNDGVYAGEGNYVSSIGSNAGGGAGGNTNQSDFLQDSTVYATPSAIPPSGVLNGSSAARNGRDVTTYVVKEGDVPSVIASSFGISLDTLLWANNLKDGDYIRPGDKLAILPISGVQYKVQRGDTLAGIAKRFKGDQSQILSFNDLSSASDLAQGQTLIIPDGQMPVVERKSQSLFTPAYAATSALKNLNGYFVAPAAGRISQGLHPHNGVDIADSCGTPVYAAAAGKVLIADGTGWNGGYGKYILLQHANGVETRYAHAMRLAVQSGEEVSQGELLMYMGETGRATGCHVHFEVLGARNPFAGMRVGTTL